MGILTDIIGRMGLGVNPTTGERVRTRRERCDDWNGTHQVIEEWDPVTKTWKRTGVMYGSKEGGAY